MTTKLENKRRPALRVNRYEIEFLALSREEIINTNAPRWRVKATVVVYR